MSRLANKRCLIVGGTTGLGLAAAARFLDEGARLVIAGRSSDKGTEAARSLATHGPVEFTACDAADAAQVDQLFADLQDSTRLDDFRGGEGLSKHALSRAYGPDEPEYSVADIVQ